MKVIPRVVSCVSEVILIDKRPSETKESKDTVIKISRDNRNKDVKEFLGSAVSRLP